MASDLLSEQSPSQCWICSISEILVKTVLLDFVSKLCAVVALPFSLGISEEVITSNVPALQEDRVVLCEVTSARHRGREGNVLTVKRDNHGMTLN